jgi:hypothetical protein
MPKRVILSGCSEVFMLPFGVGDTSFDFNYHGGYDCVLRGGLTNRNMGNPEYYVIDENDTDHIRVGRVGRRSGKERFITAKGIFDKKCWLYHGSFFYMGPNRFRVHDIDVDDFGRSIDVFREWENLSDTGYKKSIIEILPYGKRKEFNQPSRS